MTTNAQMLAFGQYVYRCDPEAFQRWLDREAEEPRDKPRLRAALNAPDPWAEES